MLSSMISNEHRRSEAESNMYIPAVANKTISICCTSEDLVHGNPSPSI